MFQRLSVGFGACATLIVLCSAGAPVDSLAADAGSGQLENELVISVRGGTTEKVFKQIDQMFQEQFGVKVSMVINTSGPAYAALRASTRNPSIDILETTTSTQLQGEVDKVFVKNDPSVVTNIKNVDPQFLDPEGFGVPFGETVTGIEYNAEIYAKNGIPAPTSWNDLFNPAVKGHLGINSISVSLGQFTIVALSRSNGTTEKTPDVAFQKIAALGQDVIIYKSPADLDNYFQQGAVWVALNGLPNFQSLQATGFPVKMIYPKEGPVASGPLFMTVVANAKHPQAAQAFDNFLLTPDVQKIFAGAALVPTVPNLDLPADTAAILPTADQMKTLITPDFGYLNDVTDDWTQRANKEFGRN